MSKQSGIGFLIQSHPLTNFEAQKYYQNKPEFKGICLRNNLSKIMNNGAYALNLDEYK